MNKAASRHNKRRSQAGFSLTELLVTTLILALLTGLVAAGVPLAQHAYTTIVDRANADVLLSTTVICIRSELDTVTTVMTDDSGAVKGFVSGKTGYASMLGSAGDSRGIVLREDRPNSEDPVETPLVSKDAATNGLHTVYDALTYAKGTFTVSNLRVLNEQGVEIASLPTYQVEVLTNPART